MRKLTLTFAEDEIDVYRFLKSRKRSTKVVVEAVRDYLAAKSNKKEQNKSSMSSISVDKYLLEKEGEIISKVKQQVLEELMIDPLAYWHTKLETESKQSNEQKLDFGIDEHIVSQVMSEDTSSLSGGIDVFDDDD